MSTVTTHVPGRQGVRLGAMRANLARDDWYPRYQSLGPFTQIIGAIFPDGEHATLQAQGGRFRVVDHEHLGTFKRRDDAARAARGEVLRQWKEWEK